MKYLYYLFFIFLFLSINLISQSRLDVLNEYASDISNPVISILSALSKDNKKPVKVIILPFSVNGEKISQLGSELANRITTKTAEKSAGKYIILDENDLKSADISDLFEEFYVQKANEKEFLLKLLEKLKPDFALMGEYGFDENKKQVYFKKLNVFSNWYSSELVKRSISTKACNIKNKDIAEIKKLHNTIIKGSGKAYLNLINWQEPGNSGLIKDFYLLSADNDNYSKILNTDQLIIEKKYKPVFNLKDSAYVYLLLYTFPDTCMNLLYPVQNETVKKVIKNEDFIKYFKIPDPVGEQALKLIVSKDAIKCNPEHIKIDNTKFKTKRLSVTETNYFLGNLNEKKRIVDSKLIKFNAVK